MPRIAALLYLFFLACLTVQNPVGAQGRGDRGAGPCPGRVNEVLEGLDIAPDMQLEMSYSPQRYGGEAGRFAGYLVWIRMAGCSGHLVIELTRHCRVRQVYGRGDCDLDGRIKSW